MECITKVNLNIEPEWLQVILTIIGLLIALRYLNQHAKKVRLERSYSLIHGCMVKISKYTGAYHIYYKKLFSPGLEFMLKELTATEAVGKIHKSYSMLRGEMNDIDHLNFEIDAEIKLIYNDDILHKWKVFLNRKDDFEILTDGINKILDDPEECEIYLLSLPYEGLLGNEHPLSVSFLKSYRQLMSTLLRYYRLQEDQIGPFPNYNLFKVLKKRP